MEIYKCCDYYNLENFLECQKCKISNWHWFTINNLLICNFCENEIETWNNNNFDYKYHLCKINNRKEYLQVKLFYYNLKEEN